MILEPISIDESEVFMRIAFEGDNELWQQFHQKDNNFEDTVLNNVKNVKELSAYMTVNCFSVILDNKAIGFSITAKGLLYSFGICLKQRKKEVVLEWLELIKKQLDGVFVLALFPENTRAINFFLRNGLTIAEKNKENVTLVYNKN